MSATPVERVSIAKRATPVTLQTPRVVKCPTPQCPGWITFDNTRHQTEPCRYCRIGVDTLRFLMSRVGADAESKALSPNVHDWFNRLMLTMAGAWGQNVYLRPSANTLIDLKAGQRGVIIEYNPTLGDAGEDGPAPLVGTILHKLLHFEAHLGTRVPQIVAKSASRDKEGLIPLLSYLVTVADHAWVTARLQQLDPVLHKAQSRWGLDLAQMLVGSESMYNRYLSERNLQKLVSVLEETGEAVPFKEAVIRRLASLTHTTLDREREETRKVYIAIQLANIRLLSPDAFEPYQQALAESGLNNVAEAVPTADRLASAISESPMGRPPQAKTTESGDQGPVVVEGGAFNHALESALKALGMANFFEVKS